MDGKLLKSSFQWSSRLESSTERYDYFSGQGSVETAVVWYSIFNTNFLDISIVLAYK
jgi:hypothetical protein